VTEINKVCVLEGCGSRQGQVAGSFEHVHEFRVSANTGVIS